MSYKTTILEILPKYEQELLKYSNNSFEKSMKVKNKYKKIKNNALVGEDYGVIEIYFLEKMDQNLS